MNPPMSSCVSDCWYTRDFFSFQDPSFKIPHGTTLLGSCLTDEHNLIVGKLKRLFESGASDPDFFVTLKMDDLECPRGIHIIIVIATCCRGDFIVHVEISDGTPKTAQWLLDHAVTPGILVVDESSALALATDNASNMTTAWDKATDKYPLIIGGPCDGHGSNLMFGDCIDHRDAQTVFDDQYFIARTIRESDWLNREVMQGCQEDFNYPFRPVLHGETRQCTKWYTANRNFSKIRGPLTRAINKPHFNQLTMSREKRTRLVELVNSAATWKKCEALVEVLRPVKEMTKLHDQAPNTTSKAYAAMMTVEEKLHEKTASQHGISSALYNHMKRKIKDRWNYMTHDIHYAGYAVDYEYWGDTVYALPKVMNALRRLAKKWLPDAAAVQRCMVQFTHYKNRQQHWVDVTGSYENLAFTPVAFWQLHGAECPELMDVATKILSIDFNVMSVERANSRMAAIWNKSNASMKPSTAAKLLYVQYNMEELRKMKSGGRKMAVQEGWLDDRLSVE